MRWRPNLRSYVFDWMGDSYSPLVDSSHFLGRSSFDIPWHAMPPANVSKHDKKFMLDISVPGFTKEELEVKIKGNYLTVKGNKPGKVKTMMTESIIEEFSMDAFERKFRLSDELSAEHIEARCENGLLQISFSGTATAEDKKPHHVKVE
ncbi:MAG: Hsp20 family protein [Bacteroidetes bacterium]|nr:Hsp20 family protein [Bacteroidota bacterium]